jgi:Zn-dependent protease with chaperone function
VASWFVVSVWLVLLRNPMMRGQAVSVVQGQWRVMVLLGLGSLAAAATLTLLWAERTRARYADADGRSVVDAEPDEPPVRSP